MVLCKVKAFAIYFDHLNEQNMPVYSGGDTVSGRVLVDVTGEVRVKSLNIIAKGVAKVRWTESRNGNTAYTQNYTEEVEYLNHYDNLIGEERDILVSIRSGSSEVKDYSEYFHKIDEDNPEEGVTVLHTGLHEFGFSFNLPQMPLATSFEGKHGSVRYWVKAELQRPWLLPVKAKKGFVVFEHIDINTPLLLAPPSSFVPFIHMIANEELRAEPIIIELVVSEQAPLAGSKEKTLCCWFCASGPISLSAKIERKGYTPGESIQIFAEVENCSSRVVVPKAALYQTQTFIAKGKGKQIQQLMSNLRADPLPQGKSQSWEGKLLKIPPVSPSIIDCPIIRVEYALVVYVDIPGGLNLSLSLPLVIGTIPLHACSSRTSSISSNCGNVRWLGPSERPEAPPSYSDLSVSEEHRLECLQGCERPDCNEEDQSALLAYNTEFRYLPPPLYSEVDPYPDTLEVCGAHEVS